MADDKLAAMPRRVTDGPSYKVGEAAFIDWTMPINQDWKKRMNQREGFLAGRASLTDAEVLRKAAEIDVSKAKRLLALYRASAGWPTVWRGRQGRQPVLPPRRSK